MAGKGSDRRARSPYCSADEFNKRWDIIFGKGPKKSDNKTGSTFKQKKIFFNKKD